MANPGLFDRREGESAAGQTARVGFLAAGLLGIIYFGGKLFRNAMTDTDDGSFGSGFASNLTWLCASLVAFPFLFMKFPEIGRYLETNVWPSIQQAFNWTSGKLGQAANYTGAKLGLTGDVATEPPANITTPAAPDRPFYEGKPGNPLQVKNVTGEELGTFAPPAARAQAETAVNQLRDVSA